jgi:hypothetical protein
MAAVIPDGVYDRALTPSMKFTTEVVAAPSPVSVTRATNAGSTETEFATVTPEEGTVAPPAGSKTRPVLVRAIVQFFLFRIVLVQKRS